MDCRDCTTRQLKCNRSSGVKVFKVKFNRQLDLYVVEKMKEVFWKETHILNVKVVGQFTCNSNEGQLKSQGQGRGQKVDKHVITCTGLTYETYISKKNQ